MRLMRWMAQVVYWWDGAPPIVSIHDTVSFEVVSAENVERVLDFRSSTQLSAFLSFLQAGDRIGLYAIARGRVVGHAWAYRSRHRPRTGSRYFRIEEGDAWIHYCSVDENFRGQRIYGAMLHELVRRLSADDGTTRILIDTKRDNKPSIKGIEKAGFVFLGHARYLVIGRWLVFRCQ